MRPKISFLKTNLTAHLPSWLDPVNFSYLNRKIVQVSTTSVFKEKETETEGETEGDAEGETGGETEGETE